MKTQSHDITTLLSITPIHNPLSSNLLICQALHDSLSLKDTFIRSKEESDMKMFDLFASIENHLKFLSSLKASRYAPKSHPKDCDSQSGIAIDSEMSAMILVKNDERIERISFKKKRDLSLLMKNEMNINDTDEINENTYTDIISLEKKVELHKDDDEMD